MLLPHRDAGDGEVTGEQGVRGAAQRVRGQEHPTDASDSVPQAEHERVECVQTQRQYRRESCHAQADERGCAVAVRVAAQAAASAGPRAEQGGVAHDAAAQEEGADERATADPPDCRPAAESQDKGLVHQNEKHERTVVLHDDGYAVAGVCRQVPTEHLHQSNRRPIKARQPMLHVVPLIKFLDVRVAKQAAFGKAQLQEQEQMLEDIRQTTPHQREYRSINTLQAEAANIRK
mmetsp:Transcript_47051/g.134689  ORF Transcript_47051/g.134689 Transcript_47051/m.134689 type:complete len:233 (+) Transcript_47051:254-952(+)